MELLDRFQQSNQVLNCVGAEAVINGKKEPIFIVTYIPPIVEQQPTEALQPTKKGK